MHRAAWVTDIHLNFLDKFERQMFYKELKDSSVDCIFITGDIGEARIFKGCPATPKLLIEMSDVVDLPIYFVLGNHDYYFGKIQDVRNEISAECKNEDIFYLTADMPHELNNDTILFGIDGWADARSGDFENSSMRLNDHTLIHDFLDVKDRNAIAEKMRQLSDKDTEILVDSLEYYLYERLSEMPKQIIVLTHVPPFEGACLHRRRASSTEALPFYCNQRLGEALLEFAKQFKDIDFTVLCGHTHEPAEYRARNNLVVLSGASEYYKPRIAQIIEF